MTAGMDDPRVWQETQQQNIWGALRKLCGSCQGRGVLNGSPHARSRVIPSSKGPPIECNLPCNLEDLYQGTTKRMKVTRDVLAANGRTRTVEEILAISIEPGWKKGTRITFPEKGHERRNLVPPDIVFVIDERPHGVYTRDGDDLVVLQQISLLEALTGYTARLTTLDGRTLEIPITNIIHPCYEEVVKGEGMPITKDASRKGNLKLRFRIEFPDQLSDEQKRAIGEVTTPLLTN